MATAVQPSTAAPQSNPRLRLAFASLFGALFIIAGVAAAVYVVPSVWDRTVAPVLAPLGGFIAVGLRLLAQAAAVAGFVYVGTVVAGANPPKGVRGGIFLTISALVTTFFVTRAVGLNFEEQVFGLPLTLIVLGALLYGTYWLLTAKQPQGWMEAIEEQGWLHTFSYKRTQGVRTRRWTLIGFLLIGWSGVYSISSHQAVGTGPWELAIPFVGTTITLLPDVEYAVPLLLAAATFWLSWRAVNMPPFADFLIATEAEMNKVSWPTRKGLYQDTIVVLVTTAVLTLFLLVVDWFWGTLLSNSYIAVLPPSQTTGADGSPQGGPPKLDW
jgi:preprotein translocase SecE subunit